MLLAISLGILIVISLFAIITGSSLSQIGAESLSGSADFNESATSFDINNIGATFYIDEFAGALVIIIAIMIIACLIGLNIFGSGLSDTSVRILSIGITYYGIWSIFSVLSYELIVNIEVIGVLLYITLTIVFTIGIVQKITKE
ncbi:MAG: hypothetical protein ACFFC1_20820 [Promethearchaeota archaeon]